MTLAQLDLLAAAHNKMHGGSQSNGRAVERGTVADLLAMHKLQAS